jgi:hypothetical protein
MHWRGVKGNYHAEHNGVEYIIARDKERVRTARSDRDVLIWSLYIDNKYHHSEYRLKDVKDDAERDAKRREEQSGS